MLFLAEEGFEGLHLPIDIGGRDDVVMISDFADCFSSRDRGFCGLQSSEMTNHGEMIDCFAHFVVPRDI
jgi:hypothetical protein